MSDLDDAIAAIVFTRMRQLEPISDVLDLEVGIVTCLVCGAGLLIDDADTVDVRRIHMDWHSR